MRGERKISTYCHYLISYQIWHKVGASNGGEVSEFSAYWMMRNRVKFILQNLGLVKKLSAFTFLIFSRIIRYPLLSNVHLLKMLVSEKIHD